MGFLGAYFGNRYLNLADTEETRLRVSRPMSVDNKSQLHRATKDVMRNLYHTDWFTFSQVNVTTSLLSRPKIDIISENKESWVKFFDNMRLYGSNTSLKRLREEVKRDSVSYGAGYIEYVWDVEGKEILDLKRVDASKIEHAKDNRKNFLILDEKGDSIGYVLHLGPNADLRSKGDPVPAKYDGIIDMQIGDIFIKPERIAEFPLYKLGNDTESLGIIEPAILQTERRKNLETSQVNSLWTNGSGIPYIKVGNDTHEPNPQMMEDALDMAANIRTSEAVAIPHYNEFGTIDAKLDSLSVEIMNGLLAASAGAGNIPLPFITGSGDATNRATLKTQREMFELKIQEKIDSFDEDWNNQVMRKLEKVNKYSKGVIASEEIRLESKDETAKRFKTYYDMRALAPEEVREYVLATETIQRDDAAYKKFSELPEPQSISGTMKIGQKSTDGLSELGADEEEEDKLEKLNAKKAKLATKK